MPMIASVSAVAAKTPVSQVRKRLAASCCRPARSSGCAREHRDAGLAPAHQRRSPVWSSGDGSALVSQQHREAARALVERQEDVGVAGRILRNAAQVGVLQHADDRPPRTLARQIAALDAAADRALARPEALRPAPTVTITLVAFAPRSVGPNARPSTTSQTDRLDVSGRDAMQIGARTIGRIDLAHAFGRIEDRALSAERNRRCERGAA